MKYLVSIIMISSTVAFARTGDVSYEYEPERQMKQAQQYVERDPSSVDWVLKNENLDSNPNKVDSVQMKKFGKDYWK